MTARTPLYQSAGIQREVPATDTLNVRGGRVLEGDVGNGSSTSFAITHSWGLSSPYVCGVTVCLNSTRAAVIPDIVFTDANTVTLTFGTAPTTNQYHYRIQG